MEKILVTGAAGFIGSHTCDFLISKGYRVLAIDNFDESYYSRQLKEDNISHLLKEERFTFYERDITQQKDMRKIFDEEKPDKVIHLAARAGVRPSIERPRGHVRYNIEGTSILLELSAKSNIKTFVFASSSSVYGNTKDVPFSEDADISRPISQYAATKVAGEALCHTYHHLYKMNIPCLRFFTVYGPRGRPDMAVAKWTEKIYNDEPVDVYGEGKLKRDFTYVTDIVRGIYGAMINAKGFEPYNLGESKTIMISDLLSTIERNLDKKAKVNMMPKQPGDVEITYADISKAEKDLGYKPEIDIENGVRRYVDWFMERKNKNR